MLVTFNRNLEVQRLPEAMPTTAASNGAPNREDMIFKGQENVKQFQVLPRPFKQMDLRC